VENGLDRDDLTYEIIGAAMEVHRELGPGLLESAYDTCLAHELSQRRIPFRRQVDLPITYKNVSLDCGYRLDLVVDDRVIVELKAVDRVEHIHRAQLLSYLRSFETNLGLLINFNVPRLKDGVHRVVDDDHETDSPPE
jgi:GxxExxY protein